LLRASTPGLEPVFILPLYAALKRRSSTVRDAVLITLRDAVLITLRDAVLITVRDAALMTARDAALMADPF